MSKLKKKGASSLISLPKESQEKSQGITTVKRKVTTSYNVPPLTLRMSLAEKQEINDWVADVNELSMHKASAAKLYRALNKMKNELTENEVSELNQKLANIIDQMP